MPNINSKNRIDFFVKALGDKSPSPGGGAATALTGAVGAALVIKVANFTIGNKKYAEYEKEAKAILKKVRLLKDKLLSLIERDARTYRHYAETKSSAAMRDTAKCVSDISKLSKDALKFCGRLKKIGNTNLKSDLDAAELFLRASARAADNLARLNRKYLKNGS